LSVLVANQHTPASTGAVRVVAAAGRGTAIAVHIDAITPPPVGVASVAARAGVGKVRASATSSTRASRETSRGGTRTTGPKARRPAGAKARRPAGAKARRPADAKVRRTTGAKVRRTTGAKARRTAKTGRRTSEAKRGRRTEWKGERGTRCVYCGAEHRAGGHSQKGLAQHSMSPSIWLLTSRSQFGALQTIVRG
jgi:hypothetical protein